MHGKKKFHRTKSQQSMQSHRGKIRSDRAQARSYQEHQIFQAERSSRSNKYSSRTSATTNPHQRAAMIVILLLLTASAAESADPTRSKDMTTVAHWGYQQIRHFQRSQVRICNKGKRSITVREIANHRATFLHAQGRTLDTCSQELIAMREKYTPIIQSYQQAPITIDSDQHRQLQAAGCDINEVARFIKSLNTQRIQREASVGHKLANCGELAGHIAHEFMSSSDETLTAHRMATVSFNNPVLSEDHVFNLIFTTENPPSFESGSSMSLMELASRYPKARAIDLWNHLSFPLSALKSKKRFQKSVGNAMRYVMYSGREIGGRLDKDHPAVIEISKRYSHSVAHYYTGLGDCQLELLPIIPKPECRLV